MIGLFTYSKSYDEAQGLNQMWHRDHPVGTVVADNSGYNKRQKYLMDRPVGASKGTFSCVIPLRHIFGFAEDYNKVVYGMNHYESHNHIS